MVPMLLSLLLQADPESSDERKIQEWIDALSSEHVDLRSEASKHLREAGERAIPLLTVALQGNDLEVTTRCKEILSTQALQWDLKHKVEPGARRLAGVGTDVPSMDVSPERHREYEDLLKGGKVSEIILRDYDWLPVIFDGILSDEKIVAEGSLWALHRIINRRKIEARMSDLNAKPRMDIYFSANVRAAEYTYWAQWWFTKRSRDLVAAWSEWSTQEHGENWKEVLYALSDGNGRTELSSWRFQVYRRIQGLGKSAYPFLISFIDNDEENLGAPAIRLLNEFTGRRSEGWSVESKAEVRADWERWLNTLK